MSIEILNGRGEGSRNNVDTSWRDVGGTDQPAFENSWANYGGAYAEAAFRMDSEGWVHLKGLVKTGSVGTTIFTLPEEYRPEATMYIKTGAYNSSSGVSPIYCRVQSDGSVDVNGSGANLDVSIWTTFEGIQFPANGAAVENRDHIHGGVALGQTATTDYKSIMWRRENGMVVAYAFFDPITASVIMAPSGRFNSDGISYMFIVVDQSQTGKRLDMSERYGLHLSASTSTYTLMHGEWGHADIRDEWTDMTLENSWVDFGIDTSNIWTNAGYYKDRYGFVHLRGLVKSGTSATATIETLPSDYRPSETHVFLTCSAAPNCSIEVTSAGVVKATNGGSTSFTSLSGICFYAGS